MHKGISRKKGHHFLYEVIGWYGVIAIIAAYFFLSFDFITAESLNYQLFNATGALAIIIHSYVKKDNQPMVLNIIWLVIAIIGLLQLD